MTELLNQAEARVLGCLLEKEAATPEYYPLTLNALRNACNQSSSRHPVVSYDDADVSQALASLREKGLIRIVYSQSNRAAKYRHVLDEALGLDLEERAVMCLLLLRGQQTVGELRTRSDRLAPFDSLEAVDRVLTRLADRDEPLVARLVRGPGQKEARNRQLLAAEPAPGTETSRPNMAEAASGPEGTDNDGGLGTSPLEPSPAPHRDPSADVRDELTTLRTAVSDLHSAMSELRAELEQLRRRIET